jgi:hypothetical protein
MSEGVPTARTGKAAPARPPIPFGLWVIGVGLVASGVIVVLGVTGNAPAFLTGGTLGIEGSLEGRNGVGLFGIAQIVAGIGMLFRVRSAWALAMFLVMIGLAANLISYFVGDPNLIRLLLLVVIAFYLNQRDVREVFVDRHATPVA